MSLTKYGPPEGEEVIHLRGKTYYTIHYPACAKGRPRRRYWVKFNCCVCGSEGLRNKANSRKSANGVCSRECRSLMISGENNHMWGGGTKTSSSGHVLVYLPGHPGAHRNYVREHRLVVEKKIGRLLGPGEVVHHIDFDKANNNEDNLALCDSVGQHNKAHWSLMSKVPKLLQMGIIKFNGDTLEYEIVGQ